MAAIFTNNAESTLLAALGAGDGTLTVQAGQGALFPNPGASEWFPLTLIKADGSAYEVVRATARATDVISITRAQEGTSAIAFSIDDYVSHRLTAAALTEFGAGANTDVPLSVTGGADKYTISVPSITAYVDGLRVAFRAHVASAGPITLKVNTLAEIDVTQADGSPLVANDVGLGQFVECVYDSTAGDFIIDKIDYPTSSTTKAGIALRGTDVDYDITTGDNAKFVTQLNASKIVEDGVSTILAASTSGQVPTAYTNRGRGAGSGLVTISGGTTNFIAGQAHHYENLTISSTGILAITQTGTCVIRCTGKFLLETGGEITMARAYAGDHARDHIGPTGDATAPSGGTNYVRHSKVPNGTMPQGGSLDSLQFEGFILNNSPLDLWHGGHGLCNVVDRIPQQAGGGLIIVANEVEFEATSYIRNMHSLPNNGTFLGACGGGVILVVADSFTQDSNTQYDAGAIATDQNRSYWQNIPTNSNINAGAGNGQLLFLDTSDNTYNVIF